MNLSETAFLLARSEGFDLRWFTPRVEDVLCGHATLASAHILWEEGKLRSDEEVHFHTRSGLLTARRMDGWIDLDFPSDPPSKAAPPPNLRKALGVRVKYVAKNRLDYLVEVDSEETVRNLTPDFRLLATIPTRGIIITSVSTSPGSDFVSRFFSPRDGIDEDPVTGSTHCCLGPFWGGRLGKTEMTGRQLSERAGSVRVRLAGARTHILGRAVTVLRGGFTKDAFGR